MSYLSKKEKQSKQLKRNAEIHLPVFPATLTPASVSSTSFYGEFPEKKRLILLKKAEKQAYPVPDNKGPNLY